MSERSLAAVRRWQQFATSTHVLWNGQLRTWKAQISGDGYVDEQRLVQPSVFPAFAQELLGYGPNDLAAEEPGAEGKPDFTPADLVTHPFVFETKSTKELTVLAGHEEQVQRYLVGASDRINRLLLTNLVGARVYERDAVGGIREVYFVNLRSLLDGPAEMVSTSGEAERLADLLEEFAHRELTLEQKLELVRRAPSWNPLIEATSSDWLCRRLQSVVDLFTTDVRRAVDRGDLTDHTVTTADERISVVDELRSLAARLGGDEEASMEMFLNADSNNELGIALRQYEAHVAYYAATRLLLVRVWEDLGLLQEILRDGGFDEWMTNYDHIVADVVRHSFERASQRYRSLFVGHRSYDWYTPSFEAYAEAIYQLANTYLGAIESDVLGRVYEQLLERVDRKLLGQYYTPRDIIGLIWDLIGFEAIADDAQAQDRLPRVLDIATGSGGFLVDACSRLRRRLAAAQAAGSTLNVQEWLNDVAENLIGIEIQRFSAYLAELNLLVQLGQVVATGPSLRLPSLGIVPGDTLALHDPVDGDPGLGDDCVRAGLISDDGDAREVAQKIADANKDGWQMDVACGNPPYIGQKAAARQIDLTRRSHPYWQQFVGHHMDYLYWFVILGVSKLRPLGRFGFVTTEYWLRAVGAKPLRRYLAQNCQIDRIIVLRNFRPFKDAPGQHTLIFTGTRRAPQTEASGRTPRVSIFEATKLDPTYRAAVLDSIRRGASSYGVNSFTSPVSPNLLGEASWSEVILTRDQFQRRQAVRASTSPLQLDPEQGVLSSANRMRKGYHQYLTIAALTQIGGNTSKHGIFLLNDQEYRSLGVLNETELKAIRVFINTQDVVPYAAVPPDQPMRLLYLAAPEGSNTTTQFPTQMPALRRHLELFGPLLRAKIEQYEEDRPWWSLHRPRPEIVTRNSRDGRWADYAVTPNWGGGGRLIVGLSPAETVPAQGLNALLTAPDISGAYVCAVFNSTPMQELADTLPPGYLRQEDFFELGAPYVPAIASDIAAAAVETADTVVSLLQYADRFPLLRDTLKEDITLAIAPDHAWVSEEGPSATTGTVSTVTWAEVVGRQSIGSNRIHRVDITHDLLGLRVNAYGPDETRSMLALSLAVDDEPLAEAMAARLRGAGALGARLRDIPALRISTQPDTLRQAYASDVVTLQALADGYRTRRKFIDDALAPYL